ncbi:MAG: thioredoxin family protein [Bacteroidales bacterium]|jgi:thioredoxin 1|nr:thioredoxin family protein [Bacteroidales bacterium]
MNRTGVLLLGLLLLGGYWELWSQNRENRPGKYIHPTIKSDSAFRAAIAAQPVAVIDFWAVWCRPCQLFLPEYEEVAKTMHKKAGFYKLDFDLCKATNEQYQVVAIPAIIIFKEGKEVKRYVGLTSKERIIADLKLIANY